MPLSVPLSELAGNSAGKKAENSFLSFQLFCGVRSLRERRLAAISNSSLSRNLNGLLRFTKVHLAMADSSSG